MKDAPSDDTIAAVATPVGQAGIGIVRISGPRASEIARRIFVPRSKTTHLQTHRLYLGDLIDPASGARIDEVLLSLMKAPKSYTREDVVEINSHSGYVLLSRILHLILKEGARLAEPGEFSLRAFMNGRIDLTQAEAIVDLVNSQSERGIQLATQQITGALKTEIQAFRQTVLEILAHIEVAVDFPDEEEAILNRENTSSQMEEDLIAPIEKIIASHQQRMIWMDGVRSVIVGRVNVGKSSLLNRLLNENKAIVTPVPGTTRDIIESTIHIEGIPLRLMDTAGFRKVRGEVERMGIRVTEEKLAEADLSLIVMDQSRPLAKEDRDILAKGERDKALVVLNKSDLPSRIGQDALQRIIGDVPMVRISALTGEGLEELRKAIRDRILGGRPIDMTSSHIVPNLRHKEALREASNLFGNALRILKEGLPLDLVAVELREGLDTLGVIVGETAPEEVLERIFSQFCIGK